MRLRLVLLLLCAVAGCHHQRALGPAGVVPISADNHELRDAFDADADKVRVLMLVSPS
jgi:hypothetical protein